MEPKGQSSAASSWASVATKPSSSPKRDIKPNHNSSKTRPNIKNTPTKPASAAPTTTPPASVATSVDGSSTKVSRPQKAPSTLGARSWSNIAAPPAPQARSPTPAPLPVAAKDNKLRQYPSQQAKQSTFSQILPQRQIPSDTCSWADLPFDLIQHHLAPYLDNTQDQYAFRQVCSNWHRATPLPCILVEGAKKVTASFLSKAKCIRLRYVGKGDFLKVAQALRSTGTNRVTESLLLYYCEISTGELASLCDAIKNNLVNLKELDLAGVEFGSVQNMHRLFDSIQAHPKITHVSLKYFYGAVDGDLARLLNNSRIASLRLSGRSGTFDGTALLDYLSSPDCALEELIIPSCNVHPEFVAQLAAVLKTSNKSLKRLDLSHNVVDRSWVDLVDALMVNRTLEHLNLESTIGCRDHDLTLFSRLAEVLKVNSVVSYLNLDSCHFSEESARHFAEALAGTRSLRHLSVRFPQIPAIFFSTGLRHNQSLTELNLSPCWMDDKSMRDLSAALAQNTTLRVLHLAAQGVSLAATKEFAAALKKNITLQVLDLDANVSIVLDHIAVVLGALAQNRGLRMVSLRYAALDDACATALSNAIKSGQSILQNLDLSNCGLSLDGVINVLTAAASSKTLKKLILAGNEISSNEAVSKAIGSVIQSCSTLAHLDLRKVRIHAGAALAIARSLQGNYNLTYLDLRENNLGTMAAAQLLKVRDERQGQLRLLL